VHTISKVQHVVGVAGKQSSNATGFASVGAINFDPRDYRPAVPTASQHIRFAAVIESSAGLTGTARLYDLAVGTYVPNSILATVNSTPTLLRSPDLGLSQLDKTYEIQVSLGSSATGPTGSDSVIVKLARIEIHHE
jgi:hypothetical protein